MREKRKLLALIFVVGVLISGIGAGIGLMEFFSLDYVGERIVGETEMATMEGEEELAYLSEGEDIRFYLGYGTRYLNLNRKTQSGTVSSIIRRKSSRSFGSTMQRSDLIIQIRMKIETR